MINHFETSCVCHVSVWRLFCDPYLTTHQSNYRCPIHKSNRITHPHTFWVLQEIEQLVRSGEIPSIQPRDVKPLLTVDDGPSHKLLDVRPVWEHEKASVAGSVHVPLFIEDAKTDPTTLLKKWIQMGYGGMWLGQRLTMLNQDFVTQVEQAVPSKNQKIVIACGEGLRYVTFSLFSIFSFLSQFRKTKLH